MQVLTIIVQNTADYRDLGVATSGEEWSCGCLPSAMGAAPFQLVARLVWFVPGRWVVRLIEG
jgi:hypothetical protein